MLALILSLLCSCTTEPSAQAYVEATRRPDQPALCDAIRDPALHGECVAMSAATIADADADRRRADPLCRKLDADDPWRGECFFLISDALNATGEDAQAICADAGIYAERCLGHALQREGAALLQVTPRGQESQAYQDLYQRALALFEGNQRVAGRKVWQIFVDQLAARDIDAPFSPAICGSVPDELCRTVFLTRMRYLNRDVGRIEETLLAACHRLPLSVEDAERSGFPPWTPDIDPVVQQALRQFCARSLPPER
ncbi:MAG: hypothetical protein AAFV53_29840 [Myxococcota bacterium]